MKNLFIALMVAILATSAGNNVFAQEITAEDEFENDGVYIGVTGSNNTIEGDFSGTDFLTNGEMVALVPKIKSDFGWGIMLGVRFGSTAFELNYITSSHSATWMGAKGKAQFNMVNMDMKIFMLTNIPFQPFLLLGVGVPWLTLEDGYADSDGVDDATFLGLGLNGGAGLSVHIIPRVSIFGGVTYRYLMFSSVSGVELDESLTQGSINYNAGLAYTF